MASFWNRARAAAKVGCQKAKAIAKASCERARAVVVKGVLLARAHARIATKHIHLVVRVLTMLARKARKLLW
jgi:hypothetical protein